MDGLIYEGTTTTSMGLWMQCQAESLAWWGVIEEVRVTEWSCFMYFTGISISEAWLHYCQCSLVKLRAELGPQQSWLLRSLSCSCLKLRFHQELLQTFLTAHWKPVHQGARTGQISLSRTGQISLSCQCHLPIVGQTVSFLIPLGMVSMAKGGSAGLFCWIMFSVIDLFPSQWFFWRLHML